jgi:hypothetical protein
VKKPLIIIAVSVVVVGIVLYGSIRLYSKLNKVDELNQRLEETAIVNDRQNSDESVDQSANHEGENLGIVSTNAPEVETLQELEGEAEPISAETTTPVPSPNNPETSVNPSDDAEYTEDKGWKKQEIDAAISADMQQLKASCQASSSSLVQQIVQELGGNDEAALDTIQSKYMSKIVAAEAECDAKFNQLLSKAKSEYGAANLSDQPLPDWSSQYESAKAQARADAITIIANAVE